MRRRACRRPTPRSSRRRPTQPAAALPGNDADDGPAQPARRATRSSRDPTVRTALLQAIDRPAIIDEALRAAPRTPRPGSIPPSSPLFDPTARPGRRLRPGGRAQGAQRGRLDAEGRRLAPHGRDKADRRSSSSARRGRRTRLACGRGRASRPTGRPLGLRGRRTSACRPVRSSPTGSRRATSRSRSSTWRSASIRTSTRCSPRARP